MRVLRSPDRVLRVEVLDDSGLPRLRVYVHGGLAARLRGWDQLAVWLLDHGWDPGGLVED